MSLVVWISTFRVDSYSSFDDSGEIDLSPHFNVFAGANNSGKSSLIRCLFGSIAANPHRSPTAFRPGELRPTAIYLHLQTSTQEVRTILAADGGQYQIPYSRTGDVQTQMQAVLDREMPWNMHVRRGTGPDFSLQNYDGFPWALPNAETGMVSVSEGNVRFSFGADSSAGQIPNIFNSRAYPTIFRFEAQRVPPSQIGYGDEGLLQANGANLPRVLSFLQNREPERFGLIVENLNEIIGNIASITTPPVGGNVEIRLWPTADTSNFELSFDLDKSGMGVAQTLCLLTAASSRHPSVIIVDEINSHLHPEAVRRLLLILSSYYPQHQYIISSHSPDVIGRSDAAKLFFVEREGFTSSVSEIDVSKVENLRRLAASLGVSLADALGADRILWVEGPTEEEVFSRMYREQNTALPLNVRISRVSDTGLFESRATKKAVARVYQHVANALSPTVNKMLFCLDRENKTDEAVKEAIQATNGKVRFLPRRNIECYVLDHEVISDVIAPLVGKAYADIDPIVADWILDHGGDVGLGASKFWKKDPQSDEWRKRVDGAKLLGRLFSEVSGATQEFQKTIHTPQLFAASGDRKMADYEALSAFTKDLFSRLLK